MNIQKYLSVAPEIAEAIQAGKPVVALESTILSHGMPYPENWEFSHKVEEIIRGEGAIPATTAIIGGKLKVGLSAEELELMCKDPTVGKVSRRDVAVYLATGKTGATTVATNVPVTIWPSTPMLMYPARQAMPVAMAQMMMGVARVRVEKR